MPANQRQYFDVVPGTTMINRRVPTATSKPYNTRYYY